MQATVITSRLHSDIAKVAEAVPWKRIAFTGMAVSYMAGADKHLFIMTALTTLRWPGGFAL